MTADVANILFLHAGALGDCVLTLALARGLTRSNPGTGVSMAARSEVVRWARDHGMLRSVYSLDSLGLHALYRPDGELPAGTTELLQPFDVIVSLLGDAGHTVSRKLLATLGPRVLPVDPRPTETTLRTGRHVTEQWAEELDRWGLKVRVDRGSALPIDPGACQTCRRELADRIAAPRDAKLILCHPGSGGLSKCVWTEVLEALMQKLCCMERSSAAWVIGPDEVERFGGDWRVRLEASAPVVYEEDVASAADLVCGADAYIGHDAGMTHLAALVGVRTIAVFGPTDPGVWGPLGPRCSVMPFPPRQRSIDPWIDALLRVVRITPRTRDTGA